MKTIIAIVIASIVAITALAFMADTSSDTVEVQNQVGVTYQGKPGLRMTENLCMDFTTGQTKLCF